MGFDGMRRLGHILADPSPSPNHPLSLRPGRGSGIDDEAEGRSRNSWVLKSLEKIAPGKGRLFDVGAATGIPPSSRPERGGSGRRRAERMEREAAADSTGSACSSAHSNRCRGARLVRSPDMV